MPDVTPFYKRHSRVLIAAGVLCCFSVVFAGLVAAYVYKFDQQLASENEIRLSEVSNAIAVHITAVVTDTQKALKAVAGAVSALDSDRGRMAYMSRIAEQYDFAYMGYAKDDGMLRATVASESVDVSREPYFQAALRGESTISDQIRRIFADRAASGILLVVPLRGEDGGALVAMLETKSLKTVLDRESFGGMGHAYIIDRDGTVVMRTRRVEFDNLFLAWRGMRFQKGSSLARVEEDVAAGRHGLAIFDGLPGNRQYAYYRPLPFNRWTVVNVVPEQAVSAKTIMLTRELAILGGGTVLLFMALLFWALRSSRLSLESRLAADAKSAFLANMSHEIRTPMNAIVGMSEIMLRDDLSPSHRRQLASILNSGKSLLTIINDILDVSRIEAGTFHMVEEPYDMETMLSDLTVIAAIRIGKKPLQFFVEPGAGLPRRLVGDMSRVKQVLLNIVGNAIKFTERGSIRLILDAERTDAGWLLRVEVRDTGIGIRAEDLDKIFIRFNRVDTRRNRNVEGTGLGLTIARKLCEMMGGHVNVASEYGKGTSFMLTFRQGEDGTELLAPPVPAPERARFSLLICEESPLAREFERACLDRLGLRYALCETPEAFRRGLRRGGVTHALAPCSVLDGSRDGQTAAGSPDGIRRIGLLALGEHSLAAPEGGTIYRPLFAVQLPGALGYAPRKGRADEHAGSEKRLFEPMPHASVLIVDDNDINIMVAEGLLEPYAMRVDHARSGMEAIRAVRDGAYDLVLMDHMMPEMDGVEAARRIRELPGKERAPAIVALTANTTVEARRLFRENGFNGFLAKPIETDKLDAVLRKWLRETNARRAADAARGA